MQASWLAYVVAQVAPAPSHRAAAMAEAMRTSEEVRPGSPDVTVVVEAGTSRHEATTSVRTRIRGWLMHASLAAFLESKEALQGPLARNARGVQGLHSALLRHSDTASSAVRASAHAWRRTHSSSSDLGGFEPALARSDARSSRRAHVVARRTPPGSPTVDLHRRDRTPSPVAASASKALDRFDRRAVLGEARAFAGRARRRARSLEEHLFDASRQGGLGERNRCAGPRRAVRRSLPSSVARIPEGAVREVSSLVRPPFRRSRRCRSCATSPRSRRGVVIPPVVVVRAGREGSPRSHATRPTASATSAELTNIAGG